LTDSANNTDVIDYLNDGEYQQVQDDWTTQRRNSEIRNSNLHKGKRKSHQKDDNEQVNKS
jgi:hypothetical protein